MALRLVGIALGLGLLGLYLAALALRARNARGLGPGETVALDNVTLFSDRLRLVGRPDRMVRERDAVIPEEWKSSKEVRPWHVLQLGTYFLLIEEQYGVRLPHGFVVTGNGNRVRVENTSELRERVLAIAAEIRGARARIEDEIPVTPQRWQCRVCGQRARCRQARG